jgi:hypothetical protein
VLIAALSLVDHAPPTKQQELQDLAAAIPGLVVTGCVLPPPAEYAALCGHYYGSFRDFLLAWEVQIEARDLKPREAWQHGDAQAGGQGKGD